MYFKCSSYIKPRKKVRGTATTFTVETPMEIETGSKTQTKVIILVIVLVITFVVIVGGVAVGTMILCKYEPKIS